MDETRPIPLKQMAARHGKTVSTLKAEADRGKALLPYVKREMGR